MQKASTTGAVGVGIHAVRPKSATASRRSPVRRANDVDEDAPEQAPPPPGMGKLVDKTV